MTFRPPGILNPDNLAARLSEKAKAYLWRKADDLSAQFPAFDVEAIHRPEAPSETVIGLTRQLDNGLVVMASHGRRGIGRALLGSVADRIVRHSQMPTLLVRGPVSQGLDVPTTADDRAMLEADRELMAV